MAAKKITGKFDSIEAVLRDIACGKMVVVVDDADRENEGDLIMAAEKTTAKAVNFMARFGRGLICVPTAPERLQQLGIERMVLNNREGHRTDFQISVDAAQGITTGISAADRDRTIKTLANPTSIADDLVQPGHVFPLRAKTGGVLQRAGHTEAAVDLARLAGCRPMGVICEVMNDNGTMARLPELRRFAKKHKLKLCSIEQLIEFRRKREKLVACEEIVRMPTDFGEFDLHLYLSTIDGQHHLALVKGSMSARRRTLVRVHSECLTGDVFGSRRCDCGPQLQQAMKQVSAAGHGVILYMRQEGRGIGLAPKIKAYKLQQKGYDTVEANEKLGFPMDLREYGIGAQILADIGIKKIRLLTNNPKKIVGLEGYGLEVVERVPIRVKPNKHNKNYLKTKREKLGHLL
ncbi:MAG: bifunctional 3,4-dihydroxy-2-butanone-4-phosphate synthase/GTP cyclohydrolase II [Verrucomicrobiota bacterium]|jgi:3,4-dihydroxy 2-butanone 4-phosphate synthase/GTP cyclohydrolase II|nr:bifunctional 3,4-dihydroxy-2-butanone-4-phosphate synthase/GTP cyclohydrolase II [Verrucomicrobiota bacterium]MDP6913596.1 bifunctional 3,4-dihydroxy-2-butanone-4-phosphate synthase/GTP cyclohydrolase II [Verrucomicrobiota bacterium]